MCPGYESHGTRTKLRGENDGNLRIIKMGTDRTNTMGARDLGPPGGYSPTSRFGFRSRLQ